MDAYCEVTDGSLAILVRTGTVPYCSFQAHQENQRYQRQDECAQKDGV